MSKKEKIDSTFKKKKEDLLDGCPKELAEWLTHPESWEMIAKEANKLSLAKCEEHLCSIDHQLWHLVEDIRKLTKAIEKLCKK